MIDLWLDVFPLVLLECSNFNFAIKVADIADDGLVTHALHVFMRNDIHVAGGGHENVGLVGGFIHGHDAIAFHRSLQRADRINFRYPYLSRKCAQAFSRSFAHVTKAGNNCNLAGQHYVSGAFDGINQGFTATIQVVELGLGYRVVHIDGWEGQVTIFGKLIETLHAGGGFFSHAFDFFQAC